ncbi:hypothetical protein [Bacterioplanoides sp.]|uniref:hypothetical protein n=1 Tax=Bacterioplanoides sp. TaxID=2066072 RepID=UPI003AFF9A9D
MSKWLTALLISLCCFSNVQASEDVKNLLQLEAHAYQLTSDISILALQQGGDRYHQRLNQTIASGDATADKLSQRWPQVSSQWQQSVRFTNDQRQSAADNSDVNLTNGLEAVQQLLYQAIHTAKSELSVEEISSENYATYEALVLLEKMVAEYMFFNLNVFGGMAAVNTQMAENAASFRDAVSRMTAAEGIKQQVLRKWNFIEKTLLNYNNQSATFIVMKTTDKIREMLIS